MYEKITGYLDFFGENASSQTDLKEKIKAFTDDFMQSGFMNPDGMEIMGAHGWMTRSALRNDAPNMTAEEACACISAFIQQESFFEGILLDQIEQGILPRILERLKELDA